MSARSIALFNIAVIVYAIVFAPVFSIGSKRIEEALASDKIENLTHVILLLQQANKAYSYLLIGCLLLMMVNAISLWFSSRKT